MIRIVDTSLVFTSVAIKTLDAIARLTVRVLSFMGFGGPRPENL